MKKSGFTLRAAEFEIFKKKPVDFSLEHAQSAVGSRISHSKMIFCKIESTFFATDFIGVVEIIQISRNCGVSFYFAILYGPSETI